MTFAIKFRGDTTRPVVAEYECPACGRFTAIVERDHAGDPPEIVSCATCAGEAEYRISAVAGRVRRFEVVRGGWQKPERKTYLDTRNLGEGQPIEEFRAERKKVWEEKRQRETMDLLR